MSLKKLVMWAESMEAALLADRPDVVYRCAFACPMMNNTTPRPIAAVKTMANKGSHVWTWGHI
jgi:hypothetical protein